MTMYPAYYLKIKYQKFSSLIDYLFIKIVDILLNFKCMSQTTTKFSDIRSTTFITIMNTNSNSVILNRP